MNLMDKALVETAPAAGILFAYHFKADGSKETLAAGDVDDEIRRGDGWFWVHLSLADTRCRNWVLQHAPLTDAAREILTGPDEHQRLDIFGREIVGVVPDLQLDFSKPTEQLCRLRFAVTDNLLVTIRRAHLRSIETTRQSVEAGTRFTSPIDLLDTIVDHFADFVNKLAERLGSDLDLAEESVWRDDLEDQSQRIAHARNQAVRVHRQLAQMSSLFHRLEPRLLAMHPDWAAPVRGLAQKLDAFDHAIAAIHDRARLLQEEMSAKMSAITNRRLFTLSVLTAAILPPTLVTGFFGMNTKDMPFQNTDGGTWYALAVAAAAGAVTYWALQRLRAL
jgi:zinc transporter